MKFLKCLFLFVAMGVASTSLNAQIGQETAFNRQLNNRDDQPLREFVESKENIELKDKSKNLEISGDVRFEWQRIQEKGRAFYEEEESSASNSSSGSKRGSSNASPTTASSSSNSPNFSGKFPQNYRYLRGGNHVNSFGSPISVNDFDVEFNLKIKYTYKDAWAMAQLQFDNPAGVRGRNSCDGVYPVFNREGSRIEEKDNKSHSHRALFGSGEGLFLTLKRAFIGYNIFADGKQRIDVELGRQKLDDIFESEIQFTSRFDGLLLRYAHTVEDIFDWYLTAGTFVVDETVNHFAYAFEVGLIDICETGLDFRYNFIDWTKRGRNRCFEYDPLGTFFRNSQVSLTYTFSQNFCSKEIPIELYCGFLVNHAAEKKRFTKHKKENLGWYAGVYIGNVDKKNDWSADIEYVYVQAQAVPDYDAGSIGRGNIYNENLYDTYIREEEVEIKNPTTSKTETVVKKTKFYPRRGNTNFHGWRFEFLYAITDNLSLDVCYQFSSQIKRSIGGPHFYNNFEIEAVYAF